MPDLDDGPECNPAHQRGDRERRRVVCRPSSVSPAARPRARTPAEEPQRVAERADGPRGQRPAAVRVRAQQREVERLGVTNELDVPPGDDAQRGAQRPLDLKVHPEQQVPARWLVQGLGLEREPLRLVVLDAQQRDYQRAQVLVLAPRVLVEHRDLAGAEHVAEDGSIYKQTRRTRPGRRRTSPPRPGRSPRWDPGSWAPWECASACWPPRRARKGPTSRSGPPPRARAHTPRARAGTPSPPSARDSLARRQR
jgi:hypothetical protein